YALAARSGQRTVRQRCRAGQSSGSPRSWLVPLRGSIAVASRWRRRSLWAWAALRGWSGVTHSISACAVIGCPRVVSKDGKLATDDSPRARFIPDDDAPTMGPPACLGLHLGRLAVDLVRASQATCRGRLAPGLNWVSVSPACPVCRRG